MNRIELHSRSGAGVRCNKRCIGGGSLGKDGLCKGRCYCNRVSNSESLILM